MFFQVFFFFIFLFFCYESLGNAHETILVSLADTCVCDTASQVMRQSQPKEKKNKKNKSQKFSV